MATRKVLKKHNTRLRKWVVRQEKFGRKKSKKNIRYKIEKMGRTTRKIWAQEKFYKNTKIEKMGSTAKKIWPQEKFKKFKIPYKINKWVVRPKKFGRKYKKTQDSTVNRLPEAMMRIPQSACEVPVIIFLMKSLWPGASMIVM